MPPPVNDQWDAVFATPIPFLLALGFVGAGVWAAMLWRYKGVNEKQTELYDLLNKTAELQTRSAVEAQNELKKTIVSLSEQIEELKTALKTAPGEDQHAAFARLEQTSATAIRQSRIASTANNAVSATLSDSRRLLASLALGARRTTCPICGEEAQELPSTGDSDRFICPKHNEFEVSGSAMSIRGGGRESPDLWERAFERAKLRAESSKRPRPRILDADFL